VRWLPDQSPAQAAADAVLEAGRTRGRLSGRLGEMGAHKPGRGAIRFLAPMPKHFDVFLSHNSKDKTAVRELAEALRARGLEVWLDEWCLLPGHAGRRSWRRSSRQSEQVRWWSAKTASAPWEDREMRALLSQAVERRIPLVPVLLPGAPQRPRLPPVSPGARLVGPPQRARPRGSRSPDGRNLPPRGAGRPFGFVPSLGPRALQRPQPDRIVTRSYAEKHPPKVVWVKAKKRR